MNRKAAVFLRQAALIAFVIGMGLMTLCAVIWSADNQAVSNRFSQHVELVRDGFFSGLLLSAVVLAAYLAAHALIERFGGLKLNGGARRAVAGGGDGVDFRGAGFAVDGRAQGDGSRRFIRAG